MSVRWARRAIFRTLEQLEEAYLILVTPDGQRHKFGDQQSDLQAELRVHDERFFRRVVWDGDQGTGDSYMDGDWSSPDLVALVRVAVRNGRRLEGTGGLLGSLNGLIHKFRHWRNNNTLTGSRRNIAAHYDLSNDFFRLFLDRHMLYSAAAFTSDGMSLEDAQIEKIDRMCRKLRLEPGDRVLEIGTGWGAFALHAASKYGCEVTTTTLSREQHAYASAQFARHRLEGRIQLRLEDYRHLRGEFDKIASIEMFEAVGLNHYDDFFGACDRLLTADGVMAMQTITMNEHHFRTYSRRSDWIQHRIFPGGQLASIREIQASLVRCTSLNLHHLEDIGLHYAQTLAEWRRRFHSAEPEVRGLGFDERFIRMWDYYLAYSEGAFRERYIGDVQLLFAKSGCRRLLYGEPIGLTQNGVVTDKRDEVQV